MKKQYKTRRKINKIYNFKKYINIKDSLDMIFNINKSFKRNFIETIDISVILEKKNFGDILKIIYLPFDIQKKDKRIALFAKDTSNEYIEAKKENIDIIGYDELYSDIEKKNINFDVLITTADNMKKLSKLSKILGPKGLMPNAKLGTITDNIKNTIEKIRNKKELKIKSDKYGNIHAKVGYITFSKDHLLKNIFCLLENIKSLNISKKNSQYIKKVFISSTMGPSIKIQLSSLIQ